MLKILLCVTMFAVAITSPAAPPTVAARSQSGRVVLGMGNSIQAGGGHRNSAGAADNLGYRQQLAAFFGWSYTDLAVPGSSIRAWGRDQNGLRTKALAMAKGPSLILIGYTENDSPIPLGAPNDLYPLQDTIYGNIDKMVVDLRGAYPRATIVLEGAASPWPVFADTVHGPGQWAKFKQIDDAKRQIALSMDIRYLPFRNYLPRPPLSQNFLDDGLHPNNRGHAVLFDISKHFYGGL